MILRTRPALSSAAKPVSALPALLLTLTGQLSWQWHGLGQTALLAALLLFVGVAVTEELTFRGFMFQRLIDGIGSWPAQLVMSAYFVLNHASALKQGDSWHYLAMLNIFIASLMFGLAYLRTRSLVTVAMLAALGKQTELKGHVRGALNNGLTRDDIKEVLMQTAIYAGVPAANHAFTEAASVFAEIEAEAVKG